MTDKASIVIILYNGGAYIGDCLESVANQGVPGPEIIVIDNGSTDGGMALVQSAYPAVRLVRNVKNTGFAAACNQGAAMAQGEFLVFLNQDTRVLPGWLAGLLAPLEVDPGVGLATAKLLLMSQPERINLCGLDLHYSGLSFGRGIMQPADSMPHAAQVGAVSGAAFALRKSLWDELGGFDPAYYMYYEDTDLSWRAWLAGYACCYAPGSVALHDAPLAPTTLALSYSARNRLVLLLKTWKLPTLILLAPGLLLAELVDWGLMAAYGKAGLRAKVSALGWVCRQWRSIRARRRAAQAARVKPDWFLLQQCSPVLKPAVMGGGLWGKALVWLVNLFFRVNYWFALGICRLLNI